MSRRCERVKKLLNAMTEEAQQSGRQISLMTQDTVKHSLTPFIGGTVNKHSISRMLASRYPELSPRLPPLRKPWMSEDNRMSIFDACAFAFAHYQNNAKQPEFELNG